MQEECIVCKAPLIYLEQDEWMECELCHKKELSKTRCQNGHYVCNDCHTKGLDTILSLCIDETSRNPIEIVRKMMDAPFCHMHGPEHHAIVPCVLLTAFRNNGEHMDYDAALSEICKRAKQVPGGTCGYWGVCGAAAGAGGSLLCRSRYFHVRYDWIQSTSQRCMAVSSKTCFHYFIQTGRCWWTSLLQTYQQNCH